MKLSYRLRFISEVMGRETYDNYIDTCCDHGLLSLHLSKKFPQSKITSVDVIPSIIKKLECDSRFNKIYLVSMPAETIILSPGKSLVFISGVGGELASKIIRGILSKNQDHSSIDFVISPNNKSHLVRKALSEFGFLSKRESLIFDQKIGYEIIYSSLSEGDIFDLVGKKCFSSKDLNHHHYLQKKLELYGIKAKYNPHVKVIYDGYLGIQKEFEKV